LFQQSVNANAVGSIGNGTIQFLIHDWLDFGAIMARFNGFLAQFRFIVPNCDVILPVSDHLGTNSHAALDGAAPPL
jgi:hypothetical protein